MKRTGWTCNAALSVAVALAGCGSLPSAPALPETRVDLDLQGQWPQPDRAPAPLFASGLRLDAADGVFRYHAGYALQPGAMFGTDAPLRPESPPNRIGEQSLQQQFGWRLPEVAGAPIEMDLRYRQQDQWLRSGLAQQAQRQLGLSWAPSLASFDLRYATSTHLATPLDCPLQGSMRMPLAELAQLQLGGSDCRVSLPREAARAAARTWSAALEWGEPADSTALRLQAIAPVPARAAPSALQQAYELGLMRQLPLGAWQAQTRVAWRSIPGAPLDNGWSTDATLRRELAGLGLSASLRNGLNSYWFAPEAAQRGSQYELGLDLSRWVSGRLPGLQPSMGVGYQWASVPGAADRNAYESSVNWNFSLYW